MRSFEADGWTLKSNDGDQAYYENKDLVACIVTPHKGNNYKYMVRVGSKEDFDRWSNVEYEEFFSTLEEAIKDLEANADTVYFREHYMEQ